MTVTLSPERAQLLAQVGHTWPAADEDRIAAMADDWRRMGSELDVVRAGHRDATRSVMAAGTGEAVAAFGDWSAESDDIVLRIIEVMARIEALLISVADGYYAAKTKIVEVLDELARDIDQVEREAAGVPVVGGALVVGVEVLLKPLYTAAATAITGIVTALTSVVVDVEVPALVALTELFKGFEQDLRRQQRPELGTDTPTTPSGWADPRNRPRGNPKVPDPGADADNRRAINYENQAAVTLARAGYDVEQLPEVNIHGQKNPDYLINGKVFDGYSPRTANTFTIWSKVIQKVEEGQADRVIVNIDAPDAKATVAGIREYFRNRPVPGLKELKVIGAGGAIIDVYP